MPIFKAIFLGVLLFIGLLLVCNGIFHAFFYIMDERGLFEGLRYINWSTLLLGAAISFLSIQQLNTPVKTPA